MKNIKRSLAVFGIVAFSAATPVSSYAAEGLFLSGSIGSTTLDHSLRRNTGSADSASNSTLDSDSSFNGRVGIGYKGAINNAGYWAVEGFYDSLGAATTNINGVLITDVDLNASYGIQLRGGVNVTDRFSVYANVGLVEVDFDIRNSYTFAPPVRDTSSTESAVSVGLGFEFQATSNVGVFAEISQINDVEFQPIPEVAFNTGRINSNELDINQLHFGIRYSF